MNSWQLLSYIVRGKALWRRKTIGGFLANIIVILAFLAIGVGLYFGFFYFFKFMNEIPEIKPLIISYSLYSLFLLVFIVIISSILITGPYIYLNKKETNLLLPLPLQSLTIFSSHFWQQILMSIWIGLLFGLPAILALRFSGGSNLFLVNGLFYLAVLVFVAVVIGNIILFLILGLTRKISSKINLLIIILIVAVLAILVVKTISPHNIFSIFEAENPEGNSLALSNLVSLYQYWPSAWYVNILLKNLNILDTQFLNQFWLIFLGVFAILIQSILAFAWYRPILESSEESSDRNLSKKSILVKYHSSRLLVMKEWLSLLRSRKDLSQFVFFIFLLGIYLGFIFRSSALGENIDQNWTPRIVIFIVLTLAYFIILIALRFVFPLTSLEKEKSWYALTLPQNRQKNFSIRIWSISLPTIILIELMVVLTAIAFGLSLWFTLPLVVLTPFMVMTLVTLSNAFGTFFPVPEKNDPEAITTTPSGLILFILSSLYALLVIYGLFFEAKKALSRSIIGINPGIYFFIIIFGSLAFVILFWYLGQRKYKKMYLA